MSASQKKQLRREEKAAALTEKQQAELKEAKKLRLYTSIFVAAIVIMIGVVIFTGIASSGFMERNTTVLTIDDHKIDAVEMNYYYIDSINNFLSSYGSYLSLIGLDSSLPLNEQYYDEEAGTTWADYFMDTAVSNAQYMYAMYDAAVENGFVLPQENLDSIDETLEAGMSSALLYGFADEEAYMCAMYGAGSSVESFRDYLIVQHTAQAYYDEVFNQFEYTDEQIEAKIAENPSAYTTYDYNYYYLSGTSFYEGGTADENGTITYSEEEIAAGLAKAEEAAKELAASENLLQLEKAIDNLSINADKDDNTVEVNGSTITSTTGMAGWVTDPSREEGEIGYIANVLTTTDENGNKVETTSGYYVIYFGGTSNNDFPLVNVRHLLISFQGGTTDANGNVTYTEEEKIAAELQAQIMLGTLEDSIANNPDADPDELFAELANQYSEDPGSNTKGGLYEDIYPGQMVPAFNDWCFDEERQIGDIGMVESTYGYHVMYFSGYSETTYLDYMVTSDLRSADIAAWQQELIAASVVSEVNTKFANMDLVLATASV